MNAYKDSDLVCGELDRNTRFDLSSCSWAEPYNYYSHLVSPIASGSPYLGKPFKHLLRQLEKVLNTGQLLVAQSQLDIKEDNQCH